MKTIKALTLSALFVGTLPVYAGFMMGPPQQAREAAFETIVSFADDATVANLQIQRDTLTDLRSQLETLRNAEEQDTTAISDVRGQLQDARQALRTDVREIVDTNGELKTALQEQREAARTERAVTRFALRDDEAFAALTEAATDEQTASLEANKMAMEALRAQASEARSAGASREDLQAIRDQMKGLISDQKDTVGDVLEANEELQSDFTASAQEFISNNRPPRGERGFGRGRP